MVGLEPLRIATLLSGDPLRVNVPVLYQLMPFKYGVLALGAPK